MAGSRGHWDYLMFCLFGYPFISVPALNRLVAYWNTRVMFVFFYFVGSAEYCIIFLYSVFISGFHSRGGKLLVPKFKGGGGKSILTVGKANCQRGANQSQGGAKAPPAP